MPCTDDILVFKHLRYPSQVILKPKYVVRITNLSTGASYAYGTNLLPSKDELSDSLLPKRMCGEGDSDPMTFDKNNYQVEIN